MRDRIALLVGWLMLCAGTAQQVEFAPDFYSFEEIAQKLSVGEHKVVCAPELRERVALVALQPRAWQQARALLEQGLDIRLRKTSMEMSRWWLERNPKVAAHERKLLSSISSSCKANWTRRLHSTGNFSQTLLRCPTCSGSFSGCWQ